MKKLLFLTITLGISFLSKGQQVENSVKEFIKEQRLDTFLTYTYPCIGYEYPIDSCEPSDTHFLIWMKSKKFFIKKFKKCFTSEVVILESDNPLTFYLLNKHQIDEEQIKEPAYYKYQKRKKGVDTLIVTTSINHSCHHTFSFKVNGSEVNKSADTYNLDFERFESGEKNINYDVNLKTKFKELIGRITALIRVFEKNSNIKI